MFRTYQYRIKDTNAKKRLEKMASAVNYVWNYCKETSSSALIHNKPFPSEFDLNNLTVGVSKELGIASTTVQEICKEYATRRKQFKKKKLKWRSFKRNLGWIPFKVASIKVAGSAIKYCKQRFKIWQSRELPEGAVIKSGSFSQDSRGRWYVNLVCSVPEPERVANLSASVGIDLGLKTMATLSDGCKITSPKAYRNLEVALSKAQRANKKRFVKNIHAKIKNIRKDHAHKESLKVAKKYGTIFVGNVSSSKLAKTKFAKSVLDTGWSQFKTLLAYKAIALGGVFGVVNEAFSTTTCAACSSRTGPRGLSAVGVREWICSACGAVLDRDINAAQNILRCGHATLTKGILAL